MWQSPFKVVHEALSHCAFRRAVSPINQARKILMANDCQSEVLTTNIIEFSKNPI